MAALHWHAALTEEFSLLGRFPRMGRRRDDLREGVHCFPFGKYLIFYDIAPNHIAIVHVIHGARDVAQAMADREA